MKLSSVNFFGIGSVCVGIGAAVLAIMPAAIIPAYAFIGGGVLGMVTYFFDKSKFDILWRNLKLGISESYPIIKRIEQKDGYILYEFTLPAGLCLEDFEKRKQAIEQFAGCPVELEYGFKNLILKAYTETEKTLYPYEPYEVKGDMEIIIGYDRCGKMVTCDLSKGEPHMYVGGETNSGKSTFLRCVLVNLVLKNDIELWLSDLKNGVEFSIFENCKKVLRLAKNVPETKTMLSEISKEVDRRYDLFRQHKVKDIKQYRKSVSKNIKYQLLVVDEFADLMYDKEAQNVLQTLAAKSRACGIHLLLATQRPDAVVLPGRLKANISTILALKCLNGTNSKIILDHPGAEDLRGFGHGIFKRGFEEVYIQSPLVEPDEAERSIKPFEKTEQPEVKEIQDFGFLDKL